MGFEDKVNNYISASEQMREEERLRKINEREAARSEVQAISTEIVELLEKYGVEPETFWEPVVMGTETIPAHNDQGRYGTRSIPERTEEIIRYQVFDHGWIIYSVHEYNDPEFPYINYVIFPDGRLHQSSGKRGILNMDDELIAWAMVIGGTVQDETALLILRDDKITERVARLIQNTQ